MHHQHHRHRPDRAAAAVRVALPGQAVVADEVEPVPRGNHRRMHLHQGQSLQVAAVGEQELGFPGLAQVPVVAHRPVVEQVGDDPAAVVQGAADHLDVARGNRRQVLQVAGDGLVEDLPPFAFVSEGHRLDRFFRGMDHDAARVGAGVGGQHGLGAIVQVQGFQDGGVPSPAVGHVEHPAAAVEAHRPGGHRVLHADGEQEGPPGFPGLLQVLHAAVGGRAEGEPQVEIVVGDEPGKPVVELHEGAVPGFQVDAVDVVEPGIAVVEADQEMLRMLRADLLNLGAHPVDGGQVPYFPRLEVDGVDMPVLVAVAVLEVDDPGAGVGPGVHADAPAGVPRDGTGLGRFLRRSRPDVEHAVDRGQVPEPGAVRTDLRRCLVRVAEKNLPRNQRRGIAGDG